MGPIHSLSVICPIFNGEEFIEEAILSIIHQSWKPKNLEIILVNDQSTDHTELICLALAQKHSNIKYISSKKNFGVAHSRNVGIKSSKYQYLSFIDQDDVWPIDKLHIQNQYIDDKFDYLIGLQSFELYKIKTFPLWFKEKWAKQPQDGHVFGTLLIEKAKFLEVGLLNESLRLTDDIDWFMRAKIKNKKEFSIPHVLIKRKIHAHNHSADIKNNGKELMWILKNKIHFERA